MTYCTQADLEERFGTAKLVQLTDKVNKPASTVDVTLVARHIGDACSLIDSYLAKRYALPLDVAPPAALTKTAVDLTWYFLLGDAAGKDSAAAVAHKAALAWLKEVAQGLVVIEGAAGALAPAGGGQIVTSKPGRVFTRDSMDGF